MWIIIEGVDGAGKSGLAQAIVKKTGARYVHLSKPESPESALDEVVIGTSGLFGAYRSTGTYSMVSDRHHWGEPVYGPLYRPHHDREGWGSFGQEGWQYAELFVASRGGVTMLVDADPAVAIARITERGDDYVTADSIQALVMRYRTLARESITLHAAVRLQQHSETPKAAALITDKAYAAATQARYMCRFPSYVGPLAGVERLLLVAGRENRLHVLKNMPPDMWKTTGFAGHIPFDELDKLRHALGDPRTLSFNPPPTMRSRKIPTSSWMPRFVQMTQES